MDLTLQVTTYKGQQALNQLSVSVNETDMSIGRASNNDFVLADVERIISHHHAHIQFENGAYYYIDESTNGSFINHSAEPIGQGNRILLHDRDVLTIGKYDCSISISMPQNKAAGSLLDDAAWQPPFHSQPEHEKPAWSKDPNHEPAPSTPSPLTGQPASLDQDYFQPPEAIREDWDALTGLNSAAQTAPFIPQPVSPQAKAEPLLHQQPPSIQPDLEQINAVKPQPEQSKVVHESAIHNQQVLDAFLSGANLTQVNLEPEELIQFMNTAGKLLREITQGFKQVLDTRTSLKSEFRLGMTTLQPTENNPLKLSLDADDALGKLLFPPMKGYMPPIQAIQEATDDLQAHQMAFLAGLRAALSSLIALFDPEVLEKDLQKASAVDSLLPYLRKAKYWDLFKIRFKEASADAENDFLHFLGDEFATAYEQQIKKLKSSRHKINP